MMKSVGRNGTQTWETQFGNVYFRPSKTKAISPQCLKGAKFSIADLKWYNGAGDVHPDYEQNKESPFYYQLTHRNHDKEGREVEFTGQLRACFPLGGFPPIPVTHVEAAETSGYLWSVDIGLVSETDKHMKTRLMDTRSGHFGVGVSPELTIEQRKLLIMFMYSFFMYDDWMGKELRSMSFRKLHQVSATLADAMRRDIITDVKGELPEGFAPYLRAVQAMREEALKTVAEQDASFMFEAFAGHVLSYAVESSQEWNELEFTDPVLFRKAHPPLRHLTFGFNFMFELIMVSSGIVLDKNVRACLFFKHLVNLCEQHTAMVNDVMSFEKEMRNKETSNHAILLHVIDGLPLEAALERTFDEINCLTNRIVKLGELLEKQFEDTPEVARAVKVAKQFIQGHYLYFPFAPRYLHDFTYDCVVEGN